MNIVLSGSSTGNMKDSYDVLTSCGAGFLILMFYIFDYLTERGSSITRPMCVDHYLKRNWNSGAWIPTKWSLAVG